MEENLAKDEVRLNVETMFDVIDYYFSNLIDRYGSVLTPWEIKTEFISTIADCLDSTIERQIMNEDTY